MVNQAKLEAREKRKAKSLEKAKRLERELKLLKWRTRKRTW